jgi:hypothetical protein
MPCHPAAVVVITGALVPDLLTSVLDGVIQSLRARGPLTELWAPKAPTPATKVAPALRLRKTTEHMVTVTPDNPHPQSTRVSISVVRAPGVSSVGDGDAADVMIVITQEKFSF